MLKKRFYPIVFSEILLIVLMSVAIAFILGENVKLVSAQEGHDDTQTPINVRDSENGAEITLQKQTAPSGLQTLSKSPLKRGVETNKEKATSLIPTSVPKPEQEDKTGLIPLKPPKPEDAATAAATAAGGAVAASNILGLGNFNNPGGHLLAGIANAGAVYGAFQFVTQMFGLDESEEEAVK